MTKVVVERPMVNNAFLDRIKVSLARFKPTSNNITWHCVPALFHAICD
jgi:hypothetical protein